MKHFTRITSLLLAVVLAFSCAGVISIADEDYTITAEAASKIKLSSTKKTIGYKQSFNLSIKNTGSKKVKWSTSNKKIAKITKVSKTKYKVTGVKPGTATIKAKVSGKTYKCKVTVSKICHTTKTLAKGTSHTLALTGVSGTVKWSTSDKSVATIKKVSNKKYKVTAKKKGTATIKAKVGGKTYKCKVTVTNPKLSKTSKSVEVGDSFNLSVSGNKGTVSWSTSNKSVASIKKVSNTKYKVTAKKKGTATIKAKVDGKTLSCKVTSKNHTHNYVLQKAKFKNGYACNYCYTDVTDWDDMYACHGAWHTHQWCILPDYYYVCSCGAIKHEHWWRWIQPEYYTDTDEVAREGYYFCYRCFSFSSDGKTIDNSIQSKCNNWVTPYDFSGENVTFTVYATDSNETDLSTQYITITCPIRSMVVGDTAQLTVNFTPANTTSSKSVTYSSSDSNVVTVNSSGKVTAVGLGEATVTAKDTLGHSATHFFRVSEVNEGVVTAADIVVDGEVVTGETLTLTKGTNHTLTLNTTPASAMYEVSYTTSVSSVVGITGSTLIGNISIDSFKNGIKYTDPESSFLAYKVGETVLTATVKDTNQNETTASVTIIVE